MSFLFGRLTFVKNYLHRELRLINLWTISHNNVIKLNNNINGRYYSTRVELSLPDNLIKKYLNNIVKVYTDKYNNNSEFTSTIEIQNIVNLLDDRLNIEENIKSLEELGEQDEEMKKIGHDEYIAYKNKLNELDEELLDVIVDNIGRDDCCDIIFEITAGVGGQEAMIFTSDLLSMYRKYFDYLDFNQNIIEIDTESGVGGVRHASILVSGIRSYELLRHEGGVHRVQRIPSTEKSGRIHTSTASVVVLPRPSDVEINLQNKDLKIETKRSSGAGGQSVNTTDSAVRIVHLPTGIAVEAQSERSQIQNKQIALIKLKTKIYNIQIDEQKCVTGLMRKKQRGMSQRNEKVRTYNYNQDRITDHRLINGTLHNLKGFMDGNEHLENLQKRLQRDFQIKLLRETIQKCK